MGAAVGTHSVFAPARATASCLNEASEEASDEKVQESLHVLWERLIELREDGCEVTGVRRSHARLGQLDFARLHGFVSLRLRYPGTDGATPWPQFVRLDWGQGGVRIFGPSAREGKLTSKVREERELKYAIFGLLALAWSVIEVMELTYLSGKVSDLTAFWQRRLEGLDVLESAAACSMFTPAAAFGTWGLSRGVRTLQGKAVTRVRFVAAALFLALCQGCWFALVSEVFQLICRSLVKSINSFITGALLVTLALPVAYLFLRHGKWYIGVSMLSTWWCLAGTILLLMSVEHKWCTPLPWIQVTISFLLGFAALLAALRESKAIRGKVCDYVAVVHEAAAIQRLADYIHTLLVTGTVYHVRNFNCWHFANDVVALLTDCTLKPDRVSSLESELVTSPRISYQDLGSGSSTEADQVLLAYVSESADSELCGEARCGRGPAVSCVSTSATGGMSYTDASIAGTDQPFLSWDSSCTTPTAASRPPS